MRNTALVLLTLLLGVLLAVSNWRLVRENRRLSDTAQYYASLRHTPAGATLPDMHGKDLNGHDLTVSYKDVKQETLLLVFSPTCPHCKRNWPAWLELVRNTKEKRVVFVNVGGPLPASFSQIYSFDSAPVMAETSAETILKYSLFEFPLTILMTPDGRCERVSVGELAPAESGALGLTEPRP